MARVIRNSGGRRVVFSIFHAVLEYHAVKVLYCFLVESSSHRQPHFSDISAGSGRLHTADSRAPLVDSGAGGPGAPTADVLDTTLTDLLDIAHKSLAEDPSLIYRYTAPLAVALLKTNDSIHREWICSQLLRARALFPDPGGVPPRLLEGEVHHGMIMPISESLGSVENWPNAFDISGPISTT